MPPAPKAVPPPEIAKPEPAPPKETTKETVKETKKDPDSLETAKDRRRKVDVSTTLVKHSPDEFSESKARADAQAREKAAETKRQTAAVISQTVRGIQSGLSGGTTIELKGPAETIDSRAARGRAAAAFPMQIGSRRSKAFMTRPGSCRPASRPIPRPRR